MPERLARIVRSIAAELRRAAARRLLDHLVSRLPRGSRGTDLLAETNLGNLQTAVKSDMLLMSDVRDPARPIDSALLWLHEQEVMRLNKGLAVFRPAMTIRLKPDRRGFAQADFAPLKLHYDEQVAQIHVMAEYVQRGVRAMAEALRLVMDYFGLSRPDFLRRWLPVRETERSLQTTPESWRSIVEELNNPVQRQAAPMLCGEGLPPDEGYEQRARLLAEFRWILVDEYQDVGPDQCALISALAGRTLADEDDKLSLFAVGDDDQNVYSFNGSSVEFIQRSEADYGARPSYLTDNYRSTGHIIAASNAVIGPARQRMKTGYAIEVDRHRRRDSSGGAWANSTR